MVDKGTKVLLDAIAYAEGHGNRLDYNTTFAYGRYTGGPVSLVNMTLAEVRYLQERMLDRQVGNALRSTAVGRYQFIRKTFDNVRAALGLPDSTLFNEETQDRMAAWLLEFRGFEMWRDGRINTFTFQNNLAHEWASIPRADTGQSHYGQGVGIKPSELKWALDRAKDTTPLSSTDGTPEPEPSDPGYEVPSTPKETPKMPRFLFGAAVGVAVGLGLAAEFEWARGWGEAIAGFGVMIVLTGVAQVRKWIKGD